MAFIRYYQYNNLVFEFKPILSDKSHWNANQLKISSLPNELLCCWSSASLKAPSPNIFASTIQNSLEFSWELEAEYFSLTRLERPGDRGYLYLLSFTAIRSFSWSDFPENYSKRIDVSFFSVLEGWNYLRSHPLVSAYLTSHVVLEAFGPAEVCQFNSFALIQQQI